jgi:phosphatidate cytidylyltransferase
VAGADPAGPQRTSATRRHELLLRVASALVLVPLAVGSAYVGGWPFAVVWGAAAMGVLWEWMVLVAPDSRGLALPAGIVGVMLVTALVASGRVPAAMIVLALATLGTAALAPSARRAWVAAAVPYAGALGLAPIVLRSDREDGLLAIIFLFAVVWATDICAYFTGRALGGPKLMRHVSPNKTWSGAFGGTIAALVAALAVARAGGSTSWLAIALVAVLLSVIAQAGDLFESFLKRRFGAKDSSHLIPGHGGLMDRLDGFVTASLAAALIGLARGGLEAPGRGLLAW